MSIPFLSIASTAINREAKKKVCKGVLDEVVELKCEVVEVKEVKEFVFEDLSRVFNLSSYPYDTILTSTNNFLFINNGKCECL